MKPRTTIILAVILILLGGFYYIYDVKMAGKKEEKKSQEDRVLPFEGKTAAGLTIKKGKETLTFEKAEGSWRMTAPENKLASSTSLEGLVGILRDTKREKVLEEKPGDLAPFGLKPPEVEIIVKASEKAGEQPKDFTLLLGSRTPSGSSYYAQVAGKPAILLIPSVLSTELEKKPADFVEKEALSLEPLNVSKVTLDYGDRTLVLDNPRNFWTSLMKDPRWTVTGKTTEAGDQAKISTFLWDIKNVKAQTFLDTKDPLVSRLKSTAPQLKVTVEQAERNPETLIILPKSGSGKEHVAMREKSGELFTLKEDEVKKLFKQVEDLKDTRLVHFDQHDIDRIEIKAGDMLVSAQKADEGWKIKKPGNIKKKIPALESIMWKLESAQYEEKLESDRNFAPATDATITIMEKNGVNPITIELKQDPGQGNKCGVIIKGGNRGFYTASGELLQHVRLLVDEVKKAQEKPPKSPAPGKSSSPSPAATVPVPAASSSPAGTPAAAPGTPAATPGAQVPVLPIVTASPGSSR